ncbi:hypothetical protein [Sulfurimonas sp.]|uniref:hypothetical protein n=1 Tax=Sulfurimonas sp. TaxID=2022749 RepID=UPI003566C318
MFRLTRIVFIPLLPLIERDYKYLGINYFKERGFDVSILETHQFLLPGYKEAVNIKYAKFDNIYEPETLNDLFKFINNLSENDYIFSFGTTPEGVKLLNKMRINTNAKFVTYVSGSIPLTSAPCGVLNNLKRAIAPVLRKFLFRYGIGTFESDIYITGAPKDELVYPFLAGPKTKKIHGHGRDYEMCMTTNSYSNKPYCVFLDTDVINASDSVIFKDIFGKDEDKNIIDYQKKLVNFFKWIEKNMSVEIIISAHPKSRIFLNKETFHGYKIVFDSSPSLVKSSEFVINEGSSAIMFAIYFNKPILFFTMKEISFFYDFPCSFTKALNKKIIPIDDLNSLKIEDIKDELNNKRKYNYYKYNYLTYENDLESVFKIIEDELIGT